MNRQEILEFINNIITEEHGTALTEEQLLIECGIDSFGYAILFTEICMKYNITMTDKEINYNELTVKNLIDKIQELIKGASPCIQKVINILLQMR